LCLIGVKIGVGSQVDRVGQIVFVGHQESVV
jgi:hypothetical protein